MFENLLFDLDMTLLDTSALAAWRKVGYWDVVMSRLDLVVAFPGPRAPHELPERLKEMGLTVGVVTSSPRHYAEALLAQWKIPYDVLITGTDGLIAKPAPDTILAAVEKLGASKESVAYVGDDPTTDVAAAAHAGVASVGVLWGGNDFTSAAPDFLIGDPELLLRLSEGLRPVGEGQVSPNLHRGSVLSLPSGGIALGRHFSPEDLRSDDGRMTSLLRDFKLNGANWSVVAPLVERGLDHLAAEQWVPDCVVCIPPWAGKTNRFAHLFAHLSDAQPEIDWASDGLTAEKDIHNYKGLSAPERAGQIEGAFASAYGWPPTWRILVLDDIHTSGATMQEAVRALRIKGAVDVRVMALAKHQHPLIAINAEMCPVCKTGYVIQRARKSDGHKFLACSRFKKANCLFTRDI